MQIFDGIPEAGNENVPFIVKAVDESAHSLGERVHSKTERHLESLDVLRAIASLAVCWFHVSNVQFTEIFSAYRHTGSYGWLGVQIFFVVSGFVIPYSLYHGKYRLRLFPTFLTKRIIRLDPPYIVSICIVLAGYLVSSHLPGHRGPVFVIPWHRVLAHLGYANAFIGGSWFQTTYWSLAIEFQYYIFIGLLFPLLVRRNRLPVIATYCLFVGSAVLLSSKDQLLPYHLPIFLFGIMVFRYKCLGINVAELAVGIGVAVCSALFVDGLPRTIAGMVAAATIMTVAKSGPIIKFFADISYSLYLVHVFIGQMVLGIGAREIARYPILKWTLPLVSVALSITVAWILFKVVESPAKRLSGRIKYMHSITKWRPLQPRFGSFHRDLPNA